MVKCPERCSSIHCPSPIKKRRDLTRIALSFSFSGTRGGSTVLHSIRQSKPKSELVETASRTHFCHFMLNNPHLRILISVCTIPWLHRPPWPTLHFSSPIPFSAKKPPRCHWFWASIPDPQELHPPTHRGRSIAIGMGKGSVSGGDGGKKIGHWSFPRTSRKKLGDLHNVIAKKWRLANPPPFPSNVPSSAPRFCFPFIRASRPQIEVRRTEKGLSL